MTRILIVDDRDESRYLLRALLGGHGFAVAEARHGAEALALARREPPDLVIADLTLPELDGFMLLRQWKADARLRLVPFVVYTATHANPEDEQLVRALGADEFLIKPAEPEALVRRMRAVIDDLHAGHRHTAQTPALGDHDVLAKYSAAVEAKLAHKVEQLDAANRQLRESEMHYRALFEAHPQPMWVYELATLRFLAVNDAALARYGYSRAEFLAMTIADLRPPEDLPRLRATVGALVAGKVHQSGIWRHRLRDGQHIDVEISSHCVNWFGRDAQFVLVNDVTARLRTERELLASERRFHATFAQAAVGFALVAPDGRFLDVNQRWCEILGYSRNELLAHTFQQLTHPDDLAPGLALVEETLAGTRRTYTLQKRCFHKLGQIVWVNLTSALVRQTGGTPDYFVSVIEDISARRHAEEALRKLSQAVEQTSESIVITDAAGLIEYVNESFVQVSGYLREELLGHNARLLQSGATPRETYAQLWATITAGRTWTGEFINRRKDGSEYIEAATVSPLREPDGRVTHYVGVKQDITGRRRTELELERHRLQLEELIRERTTQLEEARSRAEEASEAKSTFLANMSHEIRTPMNGVLGILEILEHSGLNDDQAEMVRTARESGRTLLGIIDDILDLTKIEARRLLIDMQPVNLVALAEDLIDSLLPVATRQQVDLAVFIDPSLPDQVMSDPLRLRQILFNLLGNAIKFSANGTDARGDVRLRIVPATGPSPSPRLTFAVTDRGIGIDAATLAHLFQPFTQAEASTTRRFGGTGLGLAICHRLAELLGGTLEATSTRGVGSTFALALPLVPAAVQPERDWPDLTGLTCTIQVTPDFDGNAIAAYLAAAGAQVRQVAATANPRIEIAAAGQAAANLYLADGHERQPRLLSPGTVRLNRAGLRRTLLLQAVALAADRADRLAATPRNPAPHGAIAMIPSEPILVAEDDAVNQRVIARQLELLGRTAEVVDDGAEALERWRQRRHAILLTDLHMPIVDGYALARAVRDIEASEGASGSTVILALTANALRGEEEFARAAGMDGYLTKPLPLEDLRRALEKHATKAAAAAVFDADTPLLRLGDPTAGRDFLVHFRQRLPAMRDALCAACATGDAMACSQAAHQLKAAARSAGALALGARCADIEAACRAPATALAGHAAVIATAADAAAAAIDDWLARQANN